MKKQGNSREKAQKHKIETFFFASFALFRGPF
jgi:hypothetical protein